MTVLAIVAGLVSIAGSAVVAFLGYLGYKLIRDGKLRTPATPRKPKETAGV